MNGISSMELLPCSLFTSAAIGIVTIIVVVVVPAAVVPSPLCEVGHHHRLVERPLENLSRRGGLGRPCGGLFLPHFPGFVAYVINLLLVGLLVAVIQRLRC
jgi:hypothetical protein